MIINGLKEKDLNGSQLHSFLERENILRFKIKYPFSIKLQITSNIFQPKHKFMIY